MLQSSRYADAAGNFARRYADFDPARQSDLMLKRASELLFANYSPQDNPRVQTFDPHRLIHPKRFDLLAKVIYAKHREKGVACQWPRALYVEHLRVLNGCHEQIPHKDGIDDFVRGFDDLLDSVRQYGYSSDVPPVPVGRDGSLLNGAHRVAACLTYVRPVPVECLETPGFDFSAAWFHTFAKHVGGGLAPKWADAMALEYCRLMPDSTRLILIPANVPSYRGLVLRLRDTNKLIYARAARINVGGCSRIFRLAFHTNGRDRDGKQLSPGIEGARDYRVILCDVAGSGDIATFCELAGINCADACVTVNGDQTIELAQYLLNENSLAWINRQTWPDFATIASIVKQYGAAIKRLQIPPDDCCAVNEAMCGSRDRTLNLVYFRSGSTWSLAGEPTARDEQELIFNPAMHFYCCGLKFAANL
jgi:hypothetical protein